jgi:hypothetical protein
MDPRLRGDDDGEVAMAGLGRMTTERVARAYTPHRIAVRDPTPPQGWSVCPRYPYWLASYALKYSIII